MYLRVVMQQLKDSGFGSRHVPRERWECDTARARVINGAFINVTCAAFTRTRVEDKRIRAPTETSDTPVCYNKWNNNIDNDF